MSIEGVLGKFEASTGTKRPTKEEVVESYVNTPLYQHLTERGVSGDMESLFASGLIDSGQEYFFEAPEDVWEAIVTRLETMKSQIAAEPNNRVAIRKRAGKDISDIRG